MFGFAKQAHVSVHIFSCSKETEDQNDLRAVLLKADRAPQGSQKQKQSAIEVVVQTMTIP